MATSSQSQRTELMESWFPLTYMLNNRGLGQADAYTFVISVPVVEKLRFVHDTVAGLRWY
jgi:hypothetical protein